jgi:hypothetical protein
LQVVLEFKGKKVSRDIVQFVPMRDFKAKHVSLLAKETLAEVPKQVVGFCKKYGIQVGVFLLYCFCAKLEVLIFARCRSQPMKPQLLQMKTMAGQGPFAGAGARRCVSQSLRHPSHFVAPAQASTRASSSRWRRRLALGR